MSSPNMCLFENLIPLRYTSFRTPVTGDTVVAPFGKMLDVWPAGRTKALKEMRPQCSCYTCSNEGSVGTVSLRLSPSVQKYVVSSNGKDGAGSTTSARSASSSSSGDAGGKSSSSTSEKSHSSQRGDKTSIQASSKLSEDIKRCVSITEVARPLMKATPLHAALATSAPDATVRAVLKARPGDARKEASGLLPLHVALEARGVPTATKLAILRTYPDAAKVDYAEADPGHPLGGTALHCAVYLGDDALVVAALLGAYPLAAKMLDARGALPVQVAVALGRPDAVVRTLLDAAPEAAKLPYPWSLHLPVHDAHCNRRHDETFTAHTTGSVVVVPTSSSSSAQNNNNANGGATTNGKALLSSTTTTLTQPTRPGGQGFGLAVKQQAPPKGPRLKTVELSTPSLLVATLLLRKRIESPLASSSSSSGSSSSSSSSGSSASTSTSAASDPFPGWYGNLRAAGKKGKQIAAVLQRRSATHAVLSAHPAAADALVEYHKMTPAHVAAAVGAPVAVFAALKRAASAPPGRDSQKNLPVHIAILRNAPPGVVATLLKP